MHMTKPQFRWDFNAGTMVTIVLACIGGIFWLSSLDSKSITLQNSMNEMKIRMEDLSDNPIRIRALEEAQKATNARLDRLSDTIIAGQENMRRDFNAAVEILRKDINAVSTKVEVLSSKISDPNEPRRTHFRP